MNNKYTTRLTAMVLLGVVSSEATATPILEWERQFGTPTSDTSEDVAVDGLGNLYITGNTRGDLGDLNAGGQDRYLAKYDSAGNQLWIHQSGNEFSNTSRSVAVDALGNVFIAGAEQTSSSDEEAFIAKYDTTGVLQWSQTIGLIGQQEVGSKIAIDSNGNAYLSGTTGGSLAAPYGGNLDVFVAKYGPTGNHLWTRQSGTNDFDYNSGVAVDAAGNVILSIQTRDPAEGDHAGNFEPALVKYDSAGNLLWQREYLTPRGDSAEDITVDEFGNIYAAGWLLVDVVINGEDLIKRYATVTKFDPAGDIIWSEQLGSNNRNDEFTDSIAVDAAGNVFITGNTQGVLGVENFGSSDAFFAKYDSMGNLLWVEQYGTSGYEGGGYLALDDLGAIYLTGKTPITGPNSSDIYLMKYTKVPEPSTAILIAFGAMLVSLGGSIDRAENRSVFQLFNGEACARRQRSIFKTSIFRKARFTRSGRTNSNHM